MRQVGLLVRRRRRQHSTLLRGLTTKQTSTLKQNRRSDWLTSPDATTYPGTVFANAPIRRRVASVVVGASGARNRDDPSTRRDGQQLRRTPAPVETSPGASLHTPRWTPPLRFSFILQLSVSFVQENVDRISESYGVREKLTAKVPNDRCQCCKPNGSK